TCNVYVVSTSSNWGIQSGSVNTSYSIDGYNGSFTSASFNIRGTSAKIGSFSRTVNHNNDGSKSVNISVSWPFNGSIGGVYIGTVTASGTANLDPIARASQPRLSATTFDMGSTITIYT